MRHAAHQQAEVKVAVYTDRISAAEAQKQFQERLIACALVGLGLLAAFSKM
jgi:hypothetical protein